ncbi:MAG: hypothetical protein TUN42_09005 [Dehalogenimonas sp.]
MPGLRVPAFHIKLLARTSRYFEGMLGGGSLTLGGSTVAEGTFTLGGSLAAGGSFTLGGAMVVGGSFTLGGSTVAEGTFTLGDSTVVGGNFTLGGATVVGGNFTVGPSTVTGGTFTLGTSVVGGGLIGGSSANTGTANIPIAISIMIMQMGKTIFFRILVTFLIVYKSITVLMHNQDPVGQTADRLPGWYGGFLNRPTIAVAPSPW